MTELEELKANVEEIKSQYIKQLEEIKAKIEELYGSEEETDNRWKPKMGEDYWWVDADGEVYRDEWGDTEFENNLFNHTDIFPTEKQAEFDSECKRIRRELMKCGKNFVPNQYNWAIHYNYRDKAIGYWVSTLCFHPFDIYFESEEMAKKAVKEVGEDRIKKYLFGVKQCIL